MQGYGLSEEGFRLFVAKYLILHVPAIQDAPLFQNNEN